MCNVQWSTLCSFLFFWIYFCENSQMLHFQHIKCNCNKYELHLARWVQLLNIQCSWINKPTEMRFSYKSNDTLFCTFIHCIGVRILVHCHPEMLVAAGQKNLKIPLPPTDKNVYIKFQHFGSKGTVFFFSFFFGGWKTLNSSFYLKASIIGYGTAIVHFID